MQTAHAMGVRQCQSRVWRREGGDSDHLYINNVLATRGRMVERHLRTVKFWVNSSWRRAKNEDDRVYVFRGNGSDKHTHTHTHTHTHIHTVYTNIEYLFSVWG